jgi:hypothetical protein
MVSQSRRSRYGDGAVHARHHVREGPGTAQDFAEAYKWFSLSASLLPASAASHSKRIEGTRCGAGKLTPDQIAEVQKAGPGMEETEERPPPKVGVADQ